MSQSPVLVRQLELTAGSTHVAVPQRLGGLQYRSLQLLVRLHRQPLGMISTGLPSGGLDSAQLSAMIWEHFGDDIAEHMRADGMPRPSGLPLDGRFATRLAPCRHEARRESGGLADVSVVVPTCNRTRTLIPCLQTILASSSPPREVIVVENRPASSQTAAALEAAFPGEARIRYLEEPKPGTSRARNRGLANARGAIVAFVDDDVLVDRHWLAHLALAFVEQPLASCVTGLILPLELETPAQLWLEQYGGFAKGYRRVVFDHTRRTVDPLFPYTAGRFGSGANMALRTRVARDIGGFDVALGGGTSASGGEDLDVFLRLMLRGHTLVYEPSALLWHRHHTSVPELRYQLLHYGRGLGALLAKQLAGTQRRDFLGRVPVGLRYLLDPASPKNARRQNDYPRQLALLELVGLLTGPSAYFVSRRASRALTAR